MWLPYAIPTNLLSGNIRDHEYAVALNQETGDTDSHSSIILSDNTFTGYQRGKIAMILYFDSLVPRLPDLFQ